MNKTTFFTPSLRAMIDWLVDWIYPVLFCSCNYDDVAKKIGLHPTVLMGLGVSGVITQGHRRQNARPCHKFLGYFLLYSDFWLSYRIKFIDFYPIYVWLLKNRMSISEAGEVHKYHRASITIANIANWILLCETKLLEHQTLIPPNSFVIFTDIWRWQPRNSTAVFVTNSKKTTAVKINSLYLIHISLELF